MNVTNPFALYIIRHAMPNQDTLYQVADRIATITLNRPDKLNAWTAIMEREVRFAVEEAERDENVRVIVLTGAGRAFCAGADMSLLSTVAEKGLDAARTAQAVQKTESKPDGVRDDFRHKYSYFPAVTKPVIAAINGPVVGLGLVIALYCDIRFASDAARFGTTFARRSARISKKALHISLKNTHRYLPGNEALSMNFEVSEKTRELLQRLQAFMDSMCIRTRRNSKRRSPRRDGSPPELSEN